MRALVAHTLREIEACTTMDRTARARLLLYGSQILAKVIETSELEKRIGEMEKKVRDLKQRREAAEERGCGRTA